MREEYFYYICQLVDAPDEYDSLLKFLYGRPFTYTIPMDANREADGIELRYRFGYDENIPSSLIASELDNKECSVLEMMAALTLRVCQIIDDSNEEMGNIFGAMIRSLGLAGQVNSRFNELYCMARIEAFLKRDYLPDGKGGIVTLIEPPRDLRGVELWDQVLWWLNENY